MRRKLNRVVSSLTAVLFGISLLNLALPSATAAPVTIESLAAKISKSGLGCNILSKRTEMPLGGVRRDCVANGEDINIEVYPTKNWSKVLKAACSLNIGFIAVSDNKSWIVVPKSRATAKKLEKPLGGKLTVYCNSKYIINETKVDFWQTIPTPKPSVKPKPSPKPSATPTPPVAGSWDKPFALGVGVLDSNFTYTPVRIEQDVTIEVCTKLVKDYPDGWIGNLCPEGNGTGKSIPDPNSKEKYVAVSVDITNYYEVIAQPLSSRTSGPNSSRVRFRLVDEQKNVYEIVDINLSDWFEIDIVPNGTGRSTTYFQVPKSLNVVNARLEVTLNNYEKSYFSFKPSATPTPTTKPSTNPTAPISGSWVKPFALGKGVKDSTFTYTPVLIEQDVTTEICAKLVEDFPSEWIGNLCPKGNGTGKSIPDPNSNEKYLAVSVDITNNSEYIATPNRNGYSSRVGFRLADAEGAIYRVVLTEFTPYIEIDIDPDKTERSVIYFQVPKTFKTSGARLEVINDSEQRYWTIS